MSQPLTQPLIDTAGIAALLGCTRAHVTDRLTKRRDFPRPLVSVSQKLRKWGEHDVRRWARGERTK